MIRRSAGVGAVAIATIVTLLSGACAGSATGEGSFDERLTACGLTTKREVTEALGGAVGAPEAAQGATNDALAGRTGCAWSRTDGSAAVLVELVRTGDMAAAVRRTGFSASARFVAARSRSDDERAVDVGDQAFWIDEQSSLHVLVDGSYIVFEVAVTSGSAAEATAVELARHSVTRVRQWAGAD